ncbi:alpha/beta hydrolase [Massilia sp. Dwa41.01b]|nr:alpha/beta hydrolase [Massilia sp. Dwa41.01b]
MRIGFMAAGLLAGALLTGCMQVRVTERQFIRPDAPGRAPDERMAVEGVKDLSVRAADGVALNGVLFEQPGARSTLVYFGGNMFHLDQHLDALLPVLAACGTNVAMFDYRGYGRTPGQPTVENMGLDALAIFDALNARYPGRVIVHGQSLGGFMAANVAPGAAGTGGGTRDHGDERDRPGRVAAAVVCPALRQHRDGRAAAPGRQPRGRGTLCGTDARHRGRKGPHDAAAHGQGRVRCRTAQRQALAAAGGRRP